MRTASPAAVRRPLPGKLPGKTLHDFEGIFLNATIAILVTDQRGFIAAANTAALREFGYRTEELTGKHVEMLIPPRLRAEHRKHHSYYISKPHTRLMGREVVGCNKKGEEFPLEIHLSNYWLGDAFYVIVFISNITERKQSERNIGNVMDELKKKVRENERQLGASLRQLEKSNERFERIRSWQEAIISNAGSIIVATDNEGIIRIVNPEAIHAIGYSAEDLIGKHTPALLHDPEELEIYRKELKEKFGVVIKKDFEIFIEKAKRNGHQGVECNMVRKDGTKLPVLLTVTTIYDSKGIPLGYLGVAIDISDRKKAEEELRRSFAKEKELGEMKTRFISMASHEFRTPLSTVLSSAYLIERYNKAEDQSQREVHLNRIISAVTMLTGILNDFMSAGRIEEGKIQVRSAQMDIPEWMSVTIKDLGGMLKKGQRIQYHHEGIRILVTDTALLKQILVNLVSNATKFSGTDTKIMIRTKLTEHAFSLSVRDQGIGISKEDQRHLMERFFRSAAVEHIQGTGLGLHIVSRYAELLGGHVQFRSRPGKGTTFTVKIPSGARQRD